MGGRSHRQTDAGTPACKKGVGSVGGGGLIFLVVVAVELWMAAGLYACADGSQVRVKGVWHAWEGVRIVRQSLAHLHAKKGLGRWETAV